MEQTATAGRLELRPSLDEFSQAMESKLQTKDAGFPDGWRPDTLEILLERLEERVDDLYDSSPEYVAAKAVDVANFAMMIRDKVRGDVFGA